MLRNTLLMAGLATFLISTPVQAAEHQILVLPDAYFPQTSYVTAGDTLVFLNESGIAITVISADEQWTTGTLANNQSSTITVVAGMTTDFFHEGVVDENGDPAVTGIISFIAAPLD
jgi:plastocyanin